MPLDLARTLMVSSFLVLAKAAIEMNFAAWPGPKNDDELIYPERCPASGGCLVHPPQRDSFPTLTASIFKTKG